MSNGANTHFWNIRLFEIDPAAVRPGLGQRLRRIRQRRLRMTLAEFGRQVALLSGRTRSFSNVTVANWESGRQEPSFATLNAIAQLANLPLCYFAGVGDLEDFPRIDWYRESHHGNDGRLRQIMTALNELPPGQQRLAMGAVEGLLEGLHRAQQPSQSEEALAEVDEEE